MARKIGDAFVEVRPDINTGAFERAGKTGILPALGRVGKTAALALGGAAVAGASLLAKNVIGTGVAYNTLEQKARAAFTAILGSSKAANTLMDQVAAFAKTSPFPRQAFIEGTQQLVGFGLSAHKVIPALQAIQDSVAAVGGGANEINQVTYALAQVQGQGKFTGDTINQLGQFGIDAAGILGKQWGKTGAQIREMASQPGGIPANKVWDPLITGLEKRFGGAAANVKNTWAGATDRVKGALRDLGSAIVEPFISKKGGGFALDWANALADRVRAAIPVVTAFETKAVDFAKVIAAAFSGKAVIDQGVLSPKALSRALAVGDALRRVADFAKVVLAVISGKTVIDTGVLSPKALGFALDFGDALTNLGRGAKAAFGQVKQALAGVDLGQVAGNALKVIQNLGPALSNIQTPSKTVTDTLNVFGKVIGFVADHIDLVVRALPLLVAGFVAYKAAATAAADVQAFVSPARVAATLATAAANFALARAIRSTAPASAEAAGAQAALNSTRLTGTFTTVKDIALMAAHRAGIIATAVAQRAAAVASKVWAAGQWLLNVALSANPIGLVVLAIAALVTGFIIAYKKSATFRAFVSAALNGVKAAALAVVHWFTGSFVPFFTQTIPGAFHSVVAWVRRNWPVILSIVTGPFGALVIYVLRHSRELHAKFTAIISAVLSWVRSHWRSIIGFFVNPIVNVVKTVVSYFGRLKDGAVSHVKSLLSWLVGVPGRIGRAFGNANAILLSIGRRIIAGLRSGITTEIKNIAGWIKAHVINPIVNAVKKFFGIKSPSTVFAGIGGHLVGGLIKGLSQTNGAAIVRKIFGGMPAALGSIVSKGLLSIAGLPGKALKALSGLGGKLAGLFGFGGGGVGKGVQRWAPFVSQVLAMLHQPASALGPVLHRMNQESSGNPRAINLTDINAQRGDPSRGLMQTIGSTFAAFAGPFRSRGIWDPFANIYAGINYAIHRYGRGWIARMTAPGGYATGTNNAKPGLAWVGERGRELVLFRGGEKVVPHRKADAFERLLAALEAGHGLGGAPLIGGDLVLPGVAERPRDQINELLHELEVLRHRAQLGV